MAMKSRAQRRPAKRWIRPGRLAIGICLLSSGSLYAADNWAFLPSIGENVSWDSNPLMLSGSHKSLFGSVTDPQFLITDKSPTTTLSAKLTLDENIFDQSDFDSTDLHTNINLDKKLERWEAGFIEQTDYDTTRTSEITTFNTNTVGSVRHFGNSYTPTISFSPDPLDKISLSGTYQDSRYDSSLFTNYHIYSVTPSYQYNVNPLNTATLSVLMQRYETDVASSSTIDSVAPTLAWTANLTPTLTANASAGAEEYRQLGSGIPNQSWKWKPVFSAGLNYKTEQDIFSLTGQRALQPYANGTDYFLNTITLNDTHNVNALFSTNIATSYLFAGNTDQSTNNLKSFISTNVGLTYHPTQKIDISASYQYRNQTLTGISGSQDDNIFMLSLVWRPVLSILNGSN